MSVSMQKAETKSIRVGTVCSIQSYNLQWKKNKKQNKNKGQTKLYSSPREIKIEPIYFVSAYY